MMWPTIPTTTQSRHPYAELGVQASAKRVAATGMIVGGWIVEERMGAGEMKARYCVAGRGKGISVTSVAVS